MLDTILLVIAVLLLLAVLGHLAHLREMLIGLKFDVNTIRQDVQEMR